MTDRVDINRLLTDMRSLKSQVQTFQRPEGLGPQDVNRVGRVGTGEGLKVDGSQKVPGFGDVMAQAVNKVNDTQRASGALAAAYERGEPGVDITDVMVASQKASVSFQAAVQVRNKLVEAYRDVMNMPI
ncbi:flagellar hook-basal body complex protein FliE [Marinimicrobium alkaliphilum]|uniref:flagellar hook-basal body complex protein FliE n=1 Tax=Marinimicrobium alkaliphilum TaxID=2202654 RepID=UPI000DB95229|nr:flagellar hook-basal body complex protein FliE [Marinimicrobium alkaliphilum]